uniref:Uncharacterized protein n=1 Tax=viral metagenome TaxID=1070528 RepID=A0A6C0EU36_9ZZZZ
MATVSLVGYQNTMVGGEVALKRKILRKSFRPNTVSVNGQTITSNNGPFRSSINLGDFLSRRYQSCGGCNQVNDVNSRIIRPKMGGGLRNDSCATETNGVTPLQVPLGSGNSKYVSDSSLFTRFKTLESINRNYNDTSFGGDKSNGSYTFIKAVRRY